jgi:hypothetical protein
VDIDPCKACFKALLHRFSAIFEWSCYLDPLFNAVLYCPVLLYLAALAQSLAWCLLVVVVLPLVVAIWVPPIANLLRLLRSFRPHTPYP